MTRIDGVVRMSDERAMSGNLKNKAFVNWKETQNITVLNQVSYTQYLMHIIFLRIKKYPRIDPIDEIYNKIV